MKNLLTEWTALDYNPEQIKEQKASDGKIRLSGIIQRADALNQNGRIYPKDILTREIRNYQKFIAENRATGELDHPDSSIINLKNVSHIMREVRMEGDAVYGTLELLNTPSGKIAQELVEGGVRLGISSRGVGSTSKEGDYNVVGEDFVLITFDLVQEPSTAQAFLYTEGKRIDETDMNRVLRKSDRIDRILNDIIARRGGKI